MEHTVHHHTHVQQIRMRQHKRSLQIMTVYIIFTINILHFCLGARGSSTSVAFRTFLADVKGTSELSEQL